MGDDEIIGGECKRVKARAPGNVDDRDLAQLRPARGGAQEQKREYEKQLNFPHNSPALAHATLPGPQQVLLCWGVDRASNSDRIKMRKTGNSAAYGLSAGLICVLIAIPNSFNCAS